MPANMPAVPVFVINLERRADRLKRVSRHLLLRGIAFERVAACDGRSADEGLLDQVMASRGPLGAIARGHRACAVSHTWAWQRFLDGSATHALFLEDDIFLASDAGSLLQETDWFPPSADLIKIEKYNRGASKILLGPSMGRTPSGRHLHRMYSRHCGAGAYILSRNGAERALRERGSMRVPVDHLLFNRSLSKLAHVLKPVLVRPGLATQYAVPYSSDTWTTDDAPPPSRWARRLRRLRRGASEIRMIPHHVAELVFLGARVRQVEFQENPPEQAMPNRPPGIRKETPHRSSNR